MSCTVEKWTTVPESWEVLAQRITEGAGHLAAATGWRCGVGLVAAREHVRVARALAGLPQTRNALVAGRLSYSKARALTRVATTETEADLVEIALASTGAQLERLAGGLRRAGSLDDVNARHERRSLSWSWAEDGALILKGSPAPRPRGQPGP